MRTTEFQNASYVVDQFSERECMLLSRFFTNLDAPVFALTNLPEVVKGALFARYSRTHKPLRRLFLDEFVGNPDLGIAAIAGALGAEENGVNLRRATELYEKVFNEYGDDSVAQLGGAHVACEQASNILTKVLERGRLASYLEQSTRYIYYHLPLGGRYRYIVPPEIARSPVADEYRESMDGLFDLYRLLRPQLEQFFQSAAPTPSDADAAVWRSTIRARVCDVLRGLLSAATLSNVGIYASGQAYERMLIRMNAHPLEEVRAYSALLLAELRKVMPAFVRRVDMRERGRKWSPYLEEIPAAMASWLPHFEASPSDAPEVVLAEWDPDAEVTVAASALYSFTDLPYQQLVEYVRVLSPERRTAIIHAYAGTRTNRRHKPGRAFECSFYRFDILADYGLFRDLQRHRMLTLDWQRLSPAHGYTIPEEVKAIGREPEWRTTVERAVKLYSTIAESHGSEIAQYALPFACRVRFYFHLNAREAMHMIELRTAQGGHPAYRRVCQKMHELIRCQAGHKAIADTMTFVDYKSYDWGRLDGETRVALKRDAIGSRVELQDP